VKVVAFFIASPEEGKKGQGHREPYFYTAILEIKIGSEEHKVTSELEWLGFLRET